MYGYGELKFNNETSYIGLFDNLYNGEGKKIFFFLIFYFFIKFFFVFLKKGFNFYEQGFYYSKSWKDSEMKEGILVHYEGGYHEGKFSGIYYL